MIREEDPWEHHLPNYLQRFEQHRTRTPFHSTISRIGEWTDRSKSKHQQEVKNGRNGDNGTQRGPPILPSRSFSNQPKTPWRASKSMRTRRGVSLCSLAPPRTDLNLAWNQPKYARRRRPPRGPPRHARDPLRIVANRAKHRREDLSLRFPLLFSRSLSLSSSSSSRLESIASEGRERAPESGKGNWIKKFPRRRRTNYETIIAVPSAFTCPT